MRRWTTAAAVGLAVVGLLMSVSLRRKFSAAASTFSEVDATYPITVNRVGGSDGAAITSNIFCQMPRSLQRAKRL